MPPFSITDENMADTILLAIAQAQQSKRAREWNHS